MRHNILFPAKIRTDLNSSSALRGGGGSTQVKGDDGRNGTHTTEIKVTALYVRHAFKTCSTLIKYKSRAF